MNQTRRLFTRSFALLPLAGALLPQAVMLTASKAALADVPEFADGESSGNLATANSHFGPDKILRLFNVHTGERYEGPYWSQGRFVQSGMDQINHLMRDFRIDESVAMDPMVLDFMYSVYQQLQTEEPIQILSAYRSPATNAKLAKSSNSVAKNSLHMTGKAIDFRVPGFDAKMLSNLAVKSRRGGVGYYQESDFIHIDTGPYRHWD